MINKRQTEALKKDCHLKKRAAGKAFSQVVEQLTAKGLILKKETIVDSTTIAAPTVCENRPLN